jgi:hypothetical protein
MSLDVKYLLLLIKKKSRRNVTTTKSDSFCSTKFSIHFYWQTCKVASAVVPLPYAIVYILLTLSQPEYSGYICRWRSSNQPAINHCFFFYRIYRKRLNFRVLSCSLLILLIFTGWRKILGFGWFMVFNATFTIFQLYLGGQFYRWR